MVMKTVYMTFDGNASEDETACAHYELSRMKLSNCCFRGV